MALRVKPLSTTEADVTSFVVDRLLTYLPAQPKVVAKASGEDLVSWAEQHFYIPETQEPIHFMPHQRAVLKAAFTPVAGKRFPYTTIVYSAPKKSGKTAIAGCITRWMAETQVPYGHIFCTGNDQEQARERAFNAMKTSIELTPGYKRGSPGILPGKWLVQESRLQCIQSGGHVKAISCDYRGEAGANPALTVWTELWGYTHDDAKRFWDEMVPVPTLPISIRLVETYAGFEGESDLLQSVYDLGHEGRQLTAQELADLSGEPLGVFEEATEPDAPVPVWVNDAASMFMYWDEGPIARRMPWQKGERGEDYYREQEETLTPLAFERFHNNRWVGAESAFIPVELWDGVPEKMVIIGSKRHDLG